MARSTLVSLVSKTDGMKIEQQIYTMELSLKVSQKRNFYFYKLRMVFFQNEFNRFVRKWGINIAKVNM